MERWNILRLWWFWVYLSKLGTLTIGNVAVIPSIFAFITVTPYSISVVIWSSTVIFFGFWIASFIPHSTHGTVVCGHHSTGIFYHTSFIIKIKTCVGFLKNILFSHIYALSQLQLELNKCTIRTNLKSIFIVWIVNIFIFWSARLNRSDCRRCCCRTCSSSFYKQICWWLFHF